MAKSPLKASCPVSDPELEIISENDHMVGLCLCRFCTCGQHMCPSLKYGKIFLKSSLQTKYKTEFVKKSAEKPSQSQTNKFLPSRHKIESVTTNNAEFTPKSSYSPKKRIQERKQSHNGFAKLTSYAMDFPNWKGSHGMLEKYRQPTSKALNLPFNGSSSYKDTFRTLSTGRIVEPKLDHCKKSTISIGYGENIQQSTTYRKNMQDFSQSDLVSKNNKAKNLHVGVPNCPHIYKTTTHEAYQPQMDKSKRVRQVRMMLSV